MSSNFTIFEVNRLNKKDSLGNHHFQRITFLFSFSLIESLTVVQVSRETGKNLLAVKQQGFLDLIITIFRSLLSVLPVLFIGRHIQGPEYTALPTFVLSCIRESQLYVNSNNWHRLPVMWNTKMSRLVGGEFACLMQCFYNLYIKYKFKLNMILQFYIINFQFSSCISKIIIVL